MANGSGAVHAAGVGTWFRRPWIAIVVGITSFYVFVTVIARYSANPSPLPRTFNSMLDHLLQGRFDVDPMVIGGEGFARNGLVYAYWGVMPAVLRLPVTVLPHWRDVNFTIAYCLLALLMMGVTKLWTVHYIVRHHVAIPRYLARAAYLVVALSGAQMCFVRPSLFQEVCLWAGLFAAIFVAAAIVAQHRGLGERERVVMAVAAGAALLTRVSTGIGLVAAFGLLLGVTVMDDRRNWRGQLRQSWRALAILTVAGIATAGVNYGRWGNPLTFADYQYYILNIEFPDRLRRTAEYGLFNIERIPFGLVYYLFPVWVLRGGDGQLLFDTTRLRLIDAAELPPSSFLLTDPLLLLLGGMAVIQWLRVRGPAGRQGGAIAAGLAVSALLMLCAISMCFRYRIDFYPVIEFLGFSGLAMAGRSGWSLKPGLVWTLTIISIGASVAVSIAYLLTTFGPGQLWIEQGVGQFYLGKIGL
ncbi:hypothetical protein [Sphingomonas mollis]|uniref:Glycosyltransferase RgtA/B/C/D-like domain-containing protein n=1 Tax=Sphingomonas mollis TaxID=2795726 RepID=A0ABS0XRG0_9SPHN|nr:hypothetical protein [Sphingomonas sp. BT553]MBJ6122627.1 hypothetical protein [Sphingomonas sp. BT553]